MFSLSDATKLMMERASTLIRIATIVLALLLVAQVPQSSPLSSQPKAYAYLTADQFVMMRGDQTIARVPIVYEFGRGDIVTTSDGRYFALLSGPKSDSTGQAASARAVVVIDSITGKIRHLRCSMCTSIAPIGSSRIIANAGDGRLRFDLSTDNVPVRFSSGPEGSSLRLLSGAGGKAIANNYANGIARYYMVLQDGSSHELAVRNAIKYDELSMQAYRYGVGRSAAIVLPDGQVQFAVSTAFSKPDSGCLVNGSVSLYSPERQGGFDLDPSPIVPPGVMPGEDGALMVVDLWWDHNSELHGTFLSGICDSKRKADSPPDSMTEWRLHDGHWLKVSDEQVRSTRSLGERARIVLSPEDSVISGYGTLFFEYDGERKEIESGVIAISTHVFSAWRG